MTLARIAGTVVAAQRSDGVEGPRFLLAEEIGPDWKPRGEFLVALDMVGADRGQMVLIAQGSSCRWTSRTEDRPIDALIIGIVDIVDVKGIVQYRG